MYVKLFKYGRSTLAHTAELREADCHAALAMTLPFNIEKSSPTDRFKVLSKTLLYDEKIRLLKRRRIHFLSRINCYKEPR